jgi:hypothetical protein
MDSREKPPEKASIKEGLRTYLALPLSSEERYGVVKSVVPPEPGLRLFISHASEDKNALARPLAEALIDAGYRIWYDDFSLVAGDSVKEQIDRGLASCNYAIVILSKAFFSKHWPKEELDGLAALESPRGAKVIIPVWHQITFRQITQHSPSLAGKKGIKSSKGLAALVKAITAAVNRENLDRYIRSPDHPEICLVGNCVTAAISSTRAHFLKKPDVSWTAFGKELFEKLKKLDDEEQNSNQG